ncbi:MAG: hypothetical protein A2V88_08725 [Elusimicrobia bacterium RBG_16_66_12]|nr:MAG: hypothetical protein A2V88_08725 [Elusimicrobia bacterium RBG_16_66_12]
MKDISAMAQEIAQFREALEQYPLLQPIINDLVRMAFQFGYFTEFHPKAVESPAERHAASAAEIAAVFREMMEIMKQGPPPHLETAQEPPPDPD